MCCVKYSLCLHCVQSGYELKQPSAILSRFNMTWIRISNASKRDRYYLDRCGRSRRLWPWQRSGRGFTSDQGRESRLWWDWGGVRERKGPGVLFGEPSKYFRSYFWFYSDRVSHGCGCPSACSRVAHNNLNIADFNFFVVCQERPEPATGGKAAFGS